MRSLDRLVWMFPAAFVAHVAEEAPGFTSWARGHARSDYSAGEFVANNAAGALMTLGAAFALTRRAPRAPGAVYTVAFTQQAVGNAAFHAMSGAPGGVTAVGVVLPLWALISHAAVREQLLTSRRVGLSVLIGVGLHGIAVRRQVYGR